MCRPEFGQRTLSEEAVAGGECLARNAIDANCSKWASAAVFSSLWSACPFLTEPASSDCWRQARTTNAVLQPTSTLSYQVSFASAHRKKCAVQRECPTASTFEDIFVEAKGSSSTPYAHKPEISGLLLLDKHLVHFQSISRHVLTF